MIVENLTRQQVLADKAHEAANFFSRGRGLMFAPPLPKGDGLVIEPCNSIHMFFMRYPLDVVFTDAGGRVLFVYRGIKPWRMGRIVKGARRAIELPEGTVDRTRTEMGDILRLQP
ncbi:MAG TPA: DUF192 domain-containing protein [Chloroflexia bacterium]|jgi:hypothetical protein